MTDIEVGSIEIENIEAVMICFIVGVIATVMMANVGIKQVTDTYDKCVEKLSDKTDEKLIQEKCPNQKAKWVVTKIVGILLCFPASIYIVKAMANR